MGGDLPEHRCFYPRLSPVPIGSTVLEHVAVGQEVRAHGQQSARVRRVDGGADYTGICQYIFHIEPDGACGAMQVGCLKDALIALCTMCCLPPATCRLPPNHLTA